MRYSLIGYPPEIVLGDVIQFTKSLTTGNHHCEEYCKGEPTRTSYRIEQTIDQSKYKVVGASLSCDSALCGYAKSHGAKFNESSASGTFDVWSRPMLWTLTTSVQEKKIEKGEPVQIDSDAIKPGKTFIIENNITEYLNVLIDVDVPKVGTLRIDPKNPPAEYFQLLSSTKIDEMETFTLKYLGK